MDPPFPCIINSSSQINCVCMEANLMEKSKVSENQMKFIDKILLLLIMMVLSEDGLRQMLLHSRLNAWRFPSIDVCIQPPTWHQVHSTDQNMPFSLSFSHSRWHGRMTARARLLPFTFNHNSIHLFRKWNMVSTQADYHHYIGSMPALSSYNIEMLSNWAFNTLKSVNAFDQFQ